MKGFLYLVETAVAAILVTLVLGSVFAAQTVTIDWTRADLAGVGNNLFDTFGGKIQLVLNETQIHDDIDMLKPANVRYTFRFKGIPKQEIYVGTNNLPVVTNYLESSYLNGRFIEYRVEGFTSQDTSLDNFDVLVLYDYDNYDDLRVRDFSEKKPVIGIEDDETDADGFLDFFKLQRYGSPKTLAPLNFLENNYIKKYFLGIGFIVNTPSTYSVDGNTHKYGVWNVKDRQALVGISSGGGVCVQETSPPPTCDPTDPIIGGYERESFNFLDERYLIKKVAYSDPEHRAYFGIKDDNFAFTTDAAKGYIDSTLLSETIIGNDDYAAMTRGKDNFKNRIWVSKPNDGDVDLEYRTLVQAAVATSIMDWYMDETDSGQTIEVSRFIPFCCDIAEVAEVSFVLWYVF